MLPEVHAQTDHILSRMGNRGTLDNIFITQKPSVRLVTGLFHNLPLFRGNILDQIIHIPEMNPQIFNRDKTMECKGAHQSQPFLIITLQFICK